MMRSWRSIRHPLGQSVQNGSSNTEPAGRSGGRSLADGSKVVGLFNRGDAPVNVTLRWEDIGLKGLQKVRDLWQKKDLGDIGGEYSCRCPVTEPFC